MSRLSPRTPPSQVTRPPPWPIANEDCPVLLPVAEVVLASMYVCPSCGGYRFDESNISIGPEGTRGKLGPVCKTCQNEGAILPREKMLVDLAAGTYLRSDSRERMIRVSSRLRCPWVYRRDEYYSMPRGWCGVEEWGPNTLRWCAIQSVISATHGVDGVRGVQVESVTFTKPIVWPDGWKRESQPRDGLYMRSATDFLLASLDYPEVVR